MGSGNRFQRQYMIFTNEDTGYEAARKPSGYVSIEVREGKGKLVSTVQNLRQGNGKYEYVLYLIRNINERTVPVRVGEFKSGANKTYLEWSFNPGNVGYSGYGIDEFDVAAVVVEFAGGRKVPVVCPLAAYKNGKQEWRKGFNVAVSEESRAKQFKPAHEEDAEFGQYKPEYESDVKTGEYMTECESDTFEGYKPEYEGATGTGLYKPMSEYESAQDAVQGNKYESEAEDDQHKQEEYKSGMETGLNKPEYEGYKETKKFGHEYEGDAEPGQQKPGYESDLSREGQRADSGDEAALQEDYDSGFGNINIDCIYLNGNMCGAFVNKNASGATQCQECEIRKNQNRVLPSTDRRVQRLRDELSRYFQKCDPFRSRRSDYTWWNVNNPVYLNNILYASGIRSPLLFNPAVMLAHYKYRHLIIGIFQHKETGKQYVVCGVPGMYMVDQKPFGELSTWAQAEGNRIRYGAFGYWLVYIDPENGRILNLN